MESRLTSSTANLKQVPWWLVLIEGIAAVLIGLLLIFAPGMSLIVLVQVLGFYWLIGGVLSLVAAFTHENQRVWNVIAGIIGIMAGFAVLRHPLWSTVFVPSVLLLFLGIMGLAYGIVEIIRAFQGGGWGSAALGITSILIALFLLFSPGMGLFTLILTLGFLAIFGGISAIILAFRMHGQETAYKPPPSRHVPATDGPLPGGPTPGAY